MANITGRFGLTVLLVAGLVSAGCRKEGAAVAPGTVPAAHEHHAPHGGTAVELGEEAYHLELVLDASTGVLQAYVLDGELENFVRIAQPEVVIAIVVDGHAQTLPLKAVANAATGETVGDTALFEVQAEWLKTIRSFEGEVKAITVKGTVFTDVKFSFPGGHGHE